MNNLEEKKILIGKILARTRSAAILANKKHDSGDLFLTLAFRSVAELKEICQKINA